MKTIVRCLILVGFGMFLLSTSAEAFLKTAKVTGLIVDENGEPVDGAEVGVGFERDTGSGTKISGKRGVTSVDGRFTAANSCNGHISYGANKDGYYRSNNVYDFQNIGFMGWQPWNPELKLVLRKIENPIPMYARNSRFANLKIPKTGEEIGFDLMHFDWVAPYGGGSHADVILKLERRVVDRTDFDSTLTISFPNRFDGIQTIKEELEYGSEFKLPRYAPENGYKDRLIFIESRKPGKRVTRNVDFLRGDVNYIFRVRSEEKDGKLVRAMYGKIQGPLIFDAVFSDTASISFKYYLNPDYTRNLEFDPKRNLFGSLPDLEQVREP